MDKEFPEDVIKIIKLYSKPHNLDLAEYLINFNEDENTPIINIHEQIDYQHTIISI